MTTQKSNGEKMKTSTETKNIAAALANAQAQLAPVLKNSQGYGYKYAALDAVMNSARDALNANGLAITQGVESRDGGWFCQTVLLHASGESIATECPIFFRSEKKMSDAQAFGSAYTYARRYSFQALLGIAPEDDDGRSAGQNTRQSHPRNNQKRDPYPQEYPAVDALPKLALVMGWQSMPPVSGYLATVAQGVEAADFTADQVTERVKNAFLEAYQSAGGSTRDEWSPEQVEALKSIGNVTECGDVVALCRGVDVLR